MHGMLQAVGIMYKHNSIKINDTLYKPAIVNAAGYMHKDTSIYISMLYESELLQICLVHIVHSRTFSIRV